MKCPECGMPMIINEWEGWIWVCFHCDHVDRPATNEEVELQEKSFVDFCDIERTNMTGKNGILT